MRQSLRVFLASPGDLALERTRARRAVNRLNQVIADIGWEVSLKMWEDLLPGRGRPQDRINVTAEECELFVGILWRRWGPPTGAFSSGFEEEFLAAERRAANDHRPEVWLFFKDVQDTSDPGPQLLQVLKFHQ